MDPVNGINQLMALLKRQLAERNERSAGSTTGTQLSRSRQPTHRAPAKVTVDEIQRRIGQRLKSIASAERSGPLGTQIFIESVLVWEFGDDILNDPGFGDFVASVRETMSHDPDLQHSLERLLERLATST